MSLSTLAGRLEAAMADHPEVTNAELARTAKVKPSSVSDWLSGESKALKAVPLLRVAARLGVHPLWLATGEGPRYASIAAESPLSTRWPFKKVHAEDLQALPAEALETVERMIRAYLGKPTVAPTAQPNAAEGIDWPALAKDVAQANPDAGERRQLLHFCHLVEAKARQLSHVSNAPGATVKIHMP